MNSMSLTMWLAYAPMLLAHRLLLRFRVAHLFRARLVLRRQSLRLVPITLHRGLYVAMKQTGTKCTG